MFTATTQERLILEFSLVSHTNLTVRCYKFDTTNLLASMIVAAKATVATLLYSSIASRFCFTPNRVSCKNFLYWSKGCLCYLTQTRISKGSLHNSTSKRRKYIQYWTQEVPLLTSDLRCTYATLLFTSYRMVFTPLSGVTADVPQNTCYTVRIFWPSFSFLIVEVTKLSRYQICYSTCRETKLNGFLNMNCVTLY